MNEWLIGLIGSLEKDETIKRVNTTLTDVSKNLQKIKIDISDDSLNNIKTKLNNAFSSINISGFIKQNSQMQQGLNQTNSAIANVQQSYAKLSSLIKNDKGSKASIGVNIDNNATQVVIENFKKILANENAIFTATENINSKGKLEDFTVNVKRATGEVESFRYEVDRASKKVNFLGGSTNDAQAIKQLEQKQKVITDYTNKLNDLKTKYSKTDLDTSSFEQVFDDFRNGITPINDLKLAFNDLQNSAKNGVQNLKSQISSFDSVQQTLNNMRDLPTMLKTLETDINSLKDKSSVAGVSIKDLTKDYKALQTEMNNKGGNVPLADSWTKSYSSLMSTIVSTQKQVETLKKAEASDNSSVKKQSQYYSKIISSYREIYSLKNKSLNATNEENKLIDKKIKSLNSSIASNTKQLKNKGLSSKEWDKEVDSIKEALKFQLELNKAKKDGKETKVSNTKVNKIDENILNQSYEQQYARISRQVSQWTDENKEARISLEDLDKAFSKLTTNLSDKDKIKFSQEFEKEATKVRNEIKLINDSYVKDSKVKKLFNDTENFYLSNTKAHKKYGSDLTDIMNKTRDGASLTTEEFSNLNDKLINVKNEAKRTGDVGFSWLDDIKNKIKKFSGWVSITTILMKSVRALKTGVTNVTEFDNALLELSKVSDLTEDGLKRITERAYELGKTVGRTGKEVVEAITEFKRAGYELEDSISMAEASLTMTNVAEGIESVADASGTLISVLKGFNMDESEAMSIVDKINEVSNTSPINFDDIAEGLERTAGTLAQSGTSIDQTIGLLTAGFAQLRSIEKVSTSLVTLSARIRGVDENGDTIDGLSAKLQDEFGKIGVNIEDADGNLRNLYYIMEDYSKILPTLTSKQKQYYAELAAGKRNVTTWNAITNQFVDAEKAVASSLESSGSAMIENEKYLNSIKGKRQELASATQKLSQDFIETDTVKNSIDALTIFVELVNKVVNKFGSLSTIIGATTLSLGLFSKKGLFGVNSLTKEMEFLGKSVSEIKTDLKSGLGFKSFSMKISKSDLTLLEKLNNEMQTLGVKSIKASERTKILQTRFSNSSVATKEYAKQLMKGKVSIEDIDKASKGASLSTKLLSGAFNLVASIGISIAFSLIAKAITSIATANKRAIESTQDATNSYKEEVSSLNDYKEKIATLTKELQDSSLSYDEAKEKRKELLGIQDELIKKYGNEEEAIKNITNAITGQSDAFDLLNEQAYRDWYTKANKGTLGGFGDSGLELAKKYMENELYNTFSQMSNSINYRTQSKYGITDELKNLDKSIMQKYNLGVDEESFRYVLEGYTPEEQLKILQNIRQDYVDGSNAIFKNLKINTSEWQNLQKNVLMELDEDINTITTQLGKHQETYQTYVAGMIRYDSNYSDEYATVLEKRMKLEEAILSNDKDSITLARKEFVDSFNNALEQSGSDKVANNFFKSLYTDLQVQFKEWEIEVGFSTNKDNIESLAKQVGSQYNATELLGMVDSETGEVTDETFANLIEKAKEYGYCVEGTADEVIELIDSLVRLGYVEGKVSNVEFDNFVIFDENTAKSMDDYNKKLKTIKSAMQDIKNVDVTSLMDTFSDYDWTDFINGTKDIETVLSELALKTLNDAKTSMVDYSAYVEKMFDDTLLSVVDLKNGINELEVVLGKVTNKQSLSASEVKRLIALYPDLADKVKTTSDGYSIEEDAIKSLLNTYIKDFNTMLTSSDTLTKKILSDASDRINAYKEEEKAMVDSVIRSADLRVRNESKGHYSSADEWVSYNGVDSLKSVLGEDLYNEYVLAKQVKQEINQEYAKKNLAISMLKETIKNPYETDTDTDKDKDKDKDKNTVDYASNSIEVLSRNATRLETVLSNTKGFKEQNEVIVELNDSLEKLKTGYGQSADLYSKKYEKAIVGLSKKTIKGIESGEEFSIKDFKDQEEFDKYNKAKEWYDKWQGAIDGIKETEQKIVDNLDQSIQNDFDLFDESIVNSFDKVLDEIDRYSDYVEENSIEHLTLLETGFEQSSKKSRELSDELKRINKEYAKGNLTQEQYTQRVDELSSQIYEASASMNTYRESIVEVMKERYDDEVEKLTDDLEKQTKALEKQIDDYKKIVDAKKESLRLSEEQRKYDKDVEESNKEITKIQSRLMELKQAIDSGDKSAIVEYRELEEKLAEEKEKLDETQHDRKVQLTEDSLDKEYDLFEETIKKEIEDITEAHNKKLESINEIYNSEKKLIIECANLTVTEFNKAYEQIKQTMSSFLITTSEELKNAYTDTSQSVSNVSNISSVLSKADKTKDSSGLSGLNKYLVTKGYGVVSKGQMVELAKALGLDDINDINMVGTDSIGRANKNRILEALKQAGFSSGGIARKDLTGVFAKNGDSLIATVKPNETILTSKFTDILPQALETMQNFTKFNTPNFDKLMQKQTSVIQINGNLLNVEGNVDKDIMLDLERFKNSFEKSITQKLLNEIGKK